jgi:hypothetical protein
MRHLIIESKAYKALDSISQKVINKREVRAQIEDGVIQARNMGFEAWKSQTPILAKYQKIVEEIILKN